MTRPDFIRSGLSEAEVNALRARAESAERQLPGLRAEMAKLDAVVHALGIEDTEEDPADCIRALVKNRDAYKAERDTLALQVEGLREAIGDLLADWDEHMRLPGGQDRERFVTSEHMPEGYWSPHAVPVQSKYIAALRRALASSTPLESKADGA